MRPPLPTRNQERLRRVPRLIPLGLVISWSLMFSAACSSSSGTFRVRNPFPEETTAISNRLKDRANPDLPSETAPEKLADEGPSPYFGRGDFVSRSDSKPSPPANPAPTLRDQAESAPPSLRRPVSTHGTPCYRCNGKGYRLSGLEAGSEFVDCDSCAGTGRR